MITIKIKGALAYQGYNYEHAWRLIKQLRDMK